MSIVLPRPTKLNFYCILSSIVVLLLVSMNCYGEQTATSEWNITADKITRFQNPESIVAEGNIVLEKREKFPPPPPQQVMDQRAWAELLEEELAETEITPEDLPQDQEMQVRTQIVIKADWVAYDVEKQSIRARGNVSVDTGDDQLRAEEADVNLETETGSFENAVITRKEYDLHLEGKTIKKTGFKTYEIDEGWVITCKINDGEVPPWSFSAAKADIEQEGYAVLKNAKFNIKNVPVFYLPYLVVPVKTQRQTGFLLPELTTSNRDGFGFNLPFFWNISESVDATLFTEYYSDRGFMPGVEFRYFMSAQNKGQLSASYLDDDLSDSDEVEYRADTGFTHTNSTRYWIRAKADHDFGDSWVSRLDIDVVSDRDYLTEFRSGATGFKETKRNYLKTFGRGFANKDEDERESSLKVKKSWGSQTLNMNLIAINDVREVESSPTPLWSLPSIDYTGAEPLFDSSFTFKWDADYVNYWRDEGIGGHRVDLFPRISTPVPVGPYLESRAEVGGRGTLYSLDSFGDAEITGDDSPNRFLFTFNTDLATTLVRDFAIRLDNASVLKHTVRPFIEYDFVTDDEDDLPDFDSVDEDKEQNEITYGVDNFLTLFDGNENHIRRYGYLRAEQSFDLRSDVDDEFSPITLKMGWTPLQKLWFTYKTEIPIEDEDDFTHTFEGYFANSRGDIFTAEYRYNEEENLEQINAFMKARILPQVEASLDIEHSISESETNEGTLALTYLAQCWSVQLKGKYTPTDERIMLMFNLANIGDSLRISY